MTKFALYVPLEAKPGKEKDVAAFLKSAVPLVDAEPGTISWFAIQEGPSSFAIFDTFNDEAGREAHLNGKVAAALMEKVKAGDLFAKAPQIMKLEIIADKLNAEMHASAEALAALREKMERELWKGVLQVRVAPPPYQPPNPALGPTPHPATPPPSSARPR